MIYLWQQGAAIKANMIYWEKTEFYDLKKKMVLDSLNWP